MAITLRTAQELLEVLRNRDAGITLALHRSLCREPQAALQLGRCGDRDVVDELLAQATEEGESPRGLLLARTLSVFPAERVEAFFVGLFLQAERGDTLRVAAAWIASQPDERFQAVLLQGLMQGQSPLRAREAARWLRFDRGLAAPPAVRRALLDSHRDHHKPYPPAEEPFLSAWLEELEGPFQGEARNALWSLGAASFEALQTYEPRLSETNREWLLRLGTRVGAPGARSLVRLALRGRSDRLIRAGLQCLAEMGDGAGDLRREAEPHLHHADPAVRETAAREAPATVDWRGRLADETDPRVRCVLVERWAQREGAAVAEDLVRLLAGSDWSMHAVVTDLLVEIGDTIVDRMRTLAWHPDRGVRTAAQRVLMRLGQEDWLEAQLLEA